MTPAPKAAAVLENGAEKAPPSGGLERAAFSLHICKIRTAGGADFARSGQEWGRIVKQTDRWYTIS